MRFKTFCSKENRRGKLRDRDRYFKDRVTYVHFCEFKRSRSDRFNSSKSGFGDRHRGHWNRDGWEIV